MISLDYIRSLYPGNEDFELRLINQFLTEAPELLAQAKLTFSQNDHVQTYSLLHKLKGSMVLVLDDDHKIMFDLYEQSFRNKQEYEARSHFFSLITELCIEVFFRLRSLYAISRC